MYVLNDPKSDIAIPFVYSHSATLSDNILTNKSDVDIIRSNILSDIYGF